MMEKSRILSRIETLSEEKKPQAAAVEKDKAASDKTEPVKQTTAEKKESASATATAAQKTTAEKKESASTTATAAQKTASQKKVAAQISSTEPPLPPETEDEKSSTEPPLPPESKEDIAANPIEADEIENASASTRIAPARRRGRGVSTTPVVKEKNPLFEKIGHIINVVLHSWLIKTAIVLAIVSFLGLYLFLSLPAIVEAQLPKILAQDGIPLKSFKVKTLGMAKAELANVVAASGEVRIRTVRLEYSLSKLWNDHAVDVMEIIGMTMNGKISQQKISFAGMENLFGSMSGSSERKGVTIERLKVTSSQLNVSRDNDPHPFVLSFDSKGFIKPEALQLETDLALLDERFSIRGKMTLDKARKMTNIKADITEGNVLADGQVVGSVTGVLSVAIEDARLTEGKANLSIETPEQTFAVDAVAVPHEDKTFSFSASFDRAFKEGVDAGDSFVGKMALKADKIMFSGTSERFMLTLPLELDVSKATNGKIAVAGLKTTLPGKLNCTGVSNCVYALSSASPFSLQGVTYDGTFNDVSLAQTLSFSFLPTDRFLTFQKGMVTLTSLLSPFSLEVAVVNDGKTNEISFAPKKNSRLSLTYNLFNGEANGSVTLTEAEAVTPEFTSPVMNALINFTQAKLQSAKILAKNVSLTKKDVVAPFDIQASVAPANAEEYTLDAAFRLMNNRLSAKAKGTYNFRNDAWSLFVEAPKATFSEQNFPFANVFPSLATRFDQAVEGTFALTGRLNITQGKVAGAVKLLAMDFSTKIGDYLLQNVTTVLNIVSLSPFETTDNQSIYIGQADVGIPFKNVSVTFKAVKEGLFVSGASAEYADANFRLIKPVLLPYEGISQPFVFDGQGISLLRLSELLKIPGLEVDAIGDAHLELTYENGKFLMDHSVLFLQKNSTIGGMFKYNPEKPPASLDPKMLAFLQSVVFKNLGVEMNGDLTGKMDFDIMLDGYSAADETQTPRNISLQLEGSLSELLTPDGIIPTLPLSLQRSIQETFK